MARSKSMLLLALAGLATVGCVNQSQYDSLKMVHRKSQEQEIELKARLEEANGRLKHLDNTTRNDPNLIAQLRDYETENATLRQKLTEIEERLAQIGDFGPLPEELDQALLQLAESNPGLMTYDPELGMVKFRSDLTFDLGSVAIKPAAAAGLTRLAQILNSEIASKYEVRIVGHTDNVPIRQANTLKQHSTNWHLSVHRSISVMNALGKAAVPETRMGVAGYGPHRPVATNAKRGNELNRRVELYLVPATYKGAFAAGAAEPVPEAPPGGVVEAPTEPGDAGGVGK